ncbi:hypothetical protein [Methylopila sp. M107]|uniref:hypothetical protein n=1 Tax=Methylopila sp. M107 TaxID=1101190 RepID=UPI000365A04A|nr:hypothetical protein [Methylopila sp. M107]
MQASEAVEIAKRAVTDLFGADGLSGLRLEEIDRGDHGVWSVTIGFVRPMALAGSVGRTKELIDAFRGDEPLGPRVYRVVRLRDDNGEVLSVKIREGLD